MEDIYRNGQYLANNPTWHDEESSWKAEHIIKIMEKNNIKPSSLCDVGCGAGGILNHMANNLNKDIIFHGYEISPQAFKICKQKEKENLNFIFGGLSSIESPFDVLMALDVFEHLEDYFTFLRSIKEKGIYKIFHTPLEINVISSLSKISLTRTREMVGHIHYFTKETLIDTLESTGYRIIDYSFTNYPIDCPAPGLLNNLRKIPREVLYRKHPSLGARIFSDYNLLVLAK
jgi:hypothetical protein